MRAIIFSIIAMLLHTVSFAHPAADLSNKSSEVLVNLRAQAVSAETNDNARVIVDIFTKVKAASGIDFPVELVITEEHADSFAQTFPGDIIVVNSRLAQYSEATLVFMLAHELGHLRKRDVVQAFSFIAGYFAESDKISTQEPNMENFYVQLKTLSHGFEFSADAFAAEVVAKLGLSLYDALMFLAERDTDDSLTHPASLDRARKLHAFMKP